MDPRLPFVAAMLILLAVMPAAAGESSFEGHKKCSNCHKSQALSWQETGHARALAALGPNERAEAKRKAGLDPARDYRADAKCLGCHVTGAGEDGGYDPREPDEYLAGVGCESCHGAGSAYRQLHRKAGERFESDKTTMPRRRLAEAGQEFLFRERCNACHLNYAGSPWAKAKEPFTPFTPALDPKYGFDFERAVRSDKAMHRHYKLDGTFTGEPLPAFHAEFQAAARPLAEKATAGD
jgi:hypothetical protein